MPSPARPLRKDAQAIPTLSYAPIGFGAILRSYWVDGFDGYDCNVVKISLDGGAPTTLVAGEPDVQSDGGNCQSIALDDRFVSWPDSRNVNGEIKRVSVNGGAVTTLAKNQLDSVSIAADATSVYWLNSGFSDTDPKREGNLVKLTLP
jgi:hypothetical protein